KHNFDYPLLSDPDRAVAKQFGVKRPGPLFNKRATFVIDTDRRVLAAISSETNMEKHADEALAVLRARSS
ncbi:MAG: redoxin domain-containing protein, partial [Acidimicrobiia bacterium]